MKINISEQIIEFAKENNGVITAADLSRKGILRGNLKNLVDIGIVAEAYKQYVARKDKDIPRLSEYAKNFRVEEKVRRYLEVLM